MRKLKEDNKENRRKTIALIKSKTLLTFPEDFGFRLESDSFLH